MTFTQLRFLLKGKIANILLMGFLASALSFLFLVLTEKNYQVETRFLIIENKVEGRDFYSLSKSSEYIGRVLGESVHSEMFIEQVAATGKVGKEFLPFDKKKRLKKWNQMVKVSNNYQLGIININVYDNNKSQALAISEAIKIVLTEKNSLFLGENRDISVKTISGPMAEKNPDASKIAFVLLGSFIIGAVLSLFWAIATEPVKKTDFISNNHKNYFQETDFAADYLEP